MADQLRPSAARLGPADLTLLSRQNAAVARLAREAECPTIAARSARAAVYYRDRRASVTRADREARRRGRAA
jgi:hypothetical protein